MLNLLRKGEHRKQDFFLLPLPLRELGRMYIRYTESLVGQSSGYMALTASASERGLCPGNVLYL